MKICLNQQKTQIEVKIGLCKSRHNDNLLIKKILLLEIYSYTTVMVICPKQQQNANWSQVSIENLIVKGRNLPRTNSTKSGTNIYFFKRK